MKKHFGSSLLRTATIASLIKLSGVALTFLYFLLCSWHSSEEEYGTFASIFSLATILGFVILGGQHLAILRFWPSLDESEGKSTADRSVGFGLLWIAVLFMLGCILFLGSAVGANWLLDYEARPAMLAALVLMTFAFALSEFSQASLRARGMVAIALAPREVGWRVLNIAAILIGASFTGVGLVYLAALSLLIVSTLQLLMTVRLSEEGWWRPMAPALRTHMGRISLGLWAGSAVHPVLSHSGTIVVAMLLGAKAAGAYFAADRIAQLLSIALIGVNQAVGPMIARSFHAGRMDEMRKLIAQGTLLAFAIAVIGFLSYVVLGRFALGLFSEGYRDAYGVLLILASGQLVNTICGPNGMLLDMVGLEWAKTWIVAIWGALGLALLWMGTTYGGLVGAAIAMAVTMAGWNLTAVWICWRRLKILPWNFTSAFAR